MGTCVRTSKLSRASCGTTLCCDSSPNRHASKHARVSDHPVIASAEPGERWLYCFPDDAMAEY
ncbi:MAG: UBP-type zinc finger domain-containing protein [Vicinamibacterales bacterium]